MIDLDKIDDAKAILKKWCDDGMESISTPIRYEQLLGLMNNLAAAEKDAARYRWLRESASTEDHGGFAYNFRLVDAIRYMPGAAPNEMMDIDDAIDEAMQCK